MNRSDNIFYKLTKENENSTTELLCNLLRTKYIRNICFEFFGISKNIFESIKLENITTQKSFDKEGIPDIIIQNRESYYIIENKIRKNTILQENQKNGYITNIKNAYKSGKDVGYIFIIPENYVHKNELMRLQEEKNNFIKIIEWENFLKHLLNLEIQNESPVISESLNYLIDIILKDTSLYNEEILFTPYEVVMLYNPKDVLESLKVCEKIFKRIKLIEEKLLEIKEFKLSPGRDNNLTEYNEGIGKYFSYNGNECIFIGLNMNLITCNKVDINDDTKNVEDYLFSLAFTKYYLKPELSIPDNINYFDDDEYIYIPLNKKYLVDEKNTGSLEAEIIGIIREVFLKNVS